MLYVIVNICGVSNNLINEYEMKWNEMSFYDVYWFLIWRISESRSTSTRNHFQENVWHQYEFVDTNLFKLDVKNLKNNLKFNEIEYQFRKN